MKDKIKYSIKWKMLAIVLICWFLPFLLLLGVMGYYLITHQADNQARQLREQLILNEQICAERLEWSIAASRQVSYDKVLQTQYQKMKKANLPYSSFYCEAQPYLSKQYRRNKAFLDTIFWLDDDPQNMNFSIYNERIGGGANQISTYWKQDHEEVAAYAKTLETSIGFLEREGRLYMLRNMVNSNYKTWGVLVMRLNTDYIFGSLTTFLKDHSVQVELDDNVMLLKGEKESFEKMEPKEQADKTGYQIDHKYLYLYHDIQKGDYSLSTSVAQSRAGMLSPLYGYQYVIGGMILSLIPILLLLLNVFSKHIAEPIQVMMHGSKEIEKGELGYQLSYRARSLEFQYLTESFDQMSGRLKYQFDHIYEEELALRDAKIMALQSHINPHFMNNTLEIINWEARLSGNLKVSKMIEALSTLMDAAIDRKKRPEVTLAEEIHYVDAYLYITSERLGKRLTVVKDLPEEIMEYPVPRLILQPVIENAVEHGVIPNGSGTVIIRGYKKDDYLYLEIENDGILTEKDRENIEKMLNNDYDISSTSSGSMGIANVNQRLKILYGEDCGLVIFQKGENHVLARLTVFARNNDQ